MYTGVPIGFIVSAIAPIGQAHWYVDGVEVYGQKETCDHIFSEHGSHTIDVKVFDTEGGWDEKSIQIDVKCQPECTQDSSINFWQSKSAIQANSFENNIQFTVDLSVYGEKIQSVLWEWGDKTTLDASTESQVEHMSAKHPSHKYSTVGEYYGIVTISSVTKSCTRNFFVIVG